MKGLKRKKKLPEFKPKIPPREMTCQYCDGMIVDWEEDREDDDQCCTYCFFVGRDWVKMMRREP